MTETRCYQKQDLTAEAAEAFAEERREDILAYRMTVKFKHRFCQAVLLCLLLPATGVAIVAQEQPLNIHYRLAMSHPSSHLFEVSIEVEIPVSAKIESLDFQM